MPRAQIKRTIKRVPRSYGIKRLIKGREATLSSINEITKEIGSFIKPVDYHARGQFGQAMKRVIERNRANDDGFTVARKRSIFVKGLRTNQMTLDGKSKPGLLPYGGCHPASLALYETLRALERLKKIKLNPKLCRMKNSEDSEMFHSTVVFQLEGRYYEADPFNIKWGKEVKEITKEDALSRRYIAPKPLSYKLSKLEVFSQRAVNDLIQADSKFQF
jgi:hypothetical protein